MVPQLISTCRALAVLLAIVASMGGEARADAQAAMGQGDLAGAIGPLRQQLAVTADPAAAAGLHLRLAGAYQGQGQLDLAIASLNDAIAAGTAADDKTVTAQAYVALTEALTWTRQFKLAAACRDKAREINTRLNSTVLASEIDMADGLLLATRGAFAAAQVAFERVAGTEATSPSVRAAAAINAARAAAGAGDAQAARRWAGEATTACAQLDDSRDKAAMLTSLGSLHVLSPAQRYGALTDAAAIAQRLNDKLVLAAALIELGTLYESQGRTDDAMLLTRRAAFEAQQTMLPDLAYRTQWQMGRLLAAKGAADDAIGAYGRALDTVQSIRPDLSIRYSPVTAWPKDAATEAPTFRRVIGPLYFELADLYFQRADERAQAGDAAGAQANLLAARDTVEKFRSAEIEDYFQERCVQVVAGERRDISGGDASTAVVYFVPLRDRLEILVTRARQLQRFTSPVTAADLDKLADQFRRMTETRGRYNLPLARQLYDVLIGPMASVTADAQIDTLVFVPDGALRTVPMAALYDGEKFLIERFAVAVSPGLTLMESRPIQRRNVKVLLSGVSEARDTFSALPYVPGELERIESVYGGQKLLNADFTVPRVQGEVAQAPYNVVHIATHGEFHSEAADSFLLAYDGRMTLDRLEQIIRPTQFRGEPVELLTLSACRTAAGDDRAALGLAGVAIKAGARAALATLWYVNDEASSMIVSRFYELLKADPANPDSTWSKAKALQQAQVEMLRFTDDEGHTYLRHPSLWAPYLIIGDWR